MGKLYKIILLFVGLLAINANIYAQVELPYPSFPSASKTNDDLLVAHFYATHHASQFTSNDNDWAGTLNLTFSKEVSDFTNYPNPASTYTNIAYTLSNRAKVNLRVIDLAGKQLAVLIKQEQTAGKQEFYWELSKNNISSGMYILILQVDGKIYSRKIIVQ
jgi:hypothetical protein